MDVARLLVLSLLGLAFLLLLTGGVLFLCAGTWEYWQAWVYLGVFFGPVLAITGYLLRRDPRLLSRRLRVRERERGQQVGQQLLNLFFLGLFVVAGLDRRYGWSHVPVVLMLVSDLLLLAGFGLVFLTFRENRYAGSTVQVEAGQQVITSGPYALVRHPMYLGALPILLLTPLALGSWWGLLVSAPLLVGLVLRILSEEALLVRELPGYEEYRRTVRWRLVPGVW